MRAADVYTIENEPISSIQLMERASAAFVEKLASLLPLDGLSVLVCCGTGNNGGDGLAIARLLYQVYAADVYVWIIMYNDRKTEDFEVNYQRLRALPIPIKEIAEAESYPDVNQDVIVDAMLGSGLNKPLAGNWLALANYLNQTGKRTIAVDIPTGMAADGNIAATWSSIIAEDVITFQRPKISFVFPESARLMKRFHVVDIGLNEKFIERLPSDFIEVTNQDIREILKERSPFSHKGTFGHGLIVAGSENTMGAALLSAEACLFTGAGLSTLCVPKSGFLAMNTRLPEVMLLERGKQIDVVKYNALAIGPGLGTGEKERKLLKELIFTESLPALVLDADALNILSIEKELLNHLPMGTILTPHMREFDRLFGASDNWFERVSKAKEEASKRNLMIILKNRFTFIAAPDGKVYVNFTGNPGMASGGMGDALTGILVSLLAQGYTSSEAAILGCYLHGRAGDLLAEEGFAVIPASQLIQKLPSTLGSFL
ncbi:NAD(P)H-hydrate dehydratase [Olivibacter sp. SDN3]|nr:NAD(P)H-hydrate dehydratase [Olivibacter sp. SDN3]